MYNAGVSGLTHEINSTLLKDNPLGDSHIRKISIYLPKSYSGSNKRYPVVYLLPGFSKNNYFLFQKHCLEESVAEKIDKLITENIIQEMIVVCVDGSTYFGGSQYINSAATGHYQDYFLNEIIPFVDEKFRTINDRANRAVIGKSSGGFGSLISIFNRPDLFSVAGCIAPDAGFEYCYLPFIPRSLSVYNKVGGLENFCRQIQRNNSKDTDFMIATSLIAMASCYSPNSSSSLGFDFLCDPISGKIKYDVWEKWLKNDPVNLAKQHSTSLKNASFISLKVGKYDEYNMHLGARMLSNLFKEMNINHKYEEYECGHFGSEFLFENIIREISEYI